MAFTSNSIIKTLSMTDRDLDKAVKLVGTNYDRRRKVTFETVKKMKNMLSKGRSIEQIAEKFEIAYNTARYNLDSTYRAEKNARRKFYKSSEPKTTMIQRVSYKRTLVAEGKLTAMA